MKLYSIFSNIAVHLYEKDFFLQEILSNSVNVTGRNYSFLLLENLCCQSKASTSVGTVFFFIVPWLPWTIFSYNVDEFYMKKNFEFSEKH